MIGETIGNFVIKSRLGRGGMGEVFLAEHKDLQTPVAIKLLNEDISSDRDHVQRFFNEARVVSKIKHAGTVKIFDSGFVQGQAYLVMELLEGESLAARVARVGAMPMADVVDISQQIASVLDATHRSGVTHRDLKPDNIYIVKDDERATGERVKILDFGIAKLSGTLASSSPKTSGTMGTPTYMAPEQWGDSSKVDWRADAYSLGCVAFELGAGRPPFVCRTIPEAYSRHLTETPPLLSTLRPDVPPEIDRLLARLLSKAPEQRAQSMAEIASMLSSVAGRRPTGPAVAVSTLAPLGQPQTLTTLGGSASEMKPRGARKIAYGAGAFVFAAVVAIVVVVAMQSKNDEPAATGGGGTPTTQPQQPQSVAPPAPPATPSQPAAATPSTTPATPAPTTPTLAATPVTTTPTQPSTTAPTTPTPTTPTPATPEPATPTPTPATPAVTTVKPATPAHPHATHPATPHPTQPVTHPTTTVMPTPVTPTPVTPPPTTPTKPPDDPMGGRL